MKFILFEPKAGGLGNCTLVNLFLASPMCREVGVAENIDQIASNGGCPEFS